MDCAVDDIGPIERYLTDGFGTDGPIERNLTDGFGAFYDASKLVMPPWPGKCSGDATVDDIFHGWHSPWMQTLLKNWPLQSA